ncbi:phosphoribosylamine--glycine ligase [Arsenicitalea aurantiaca]|uniref:Phosphoribosylamine--glycine ligase n=1 Tax=Arsenicitalea aurantiaca TaxID=1783274 RepID=A0A433XAU8_9HYPH|nr:phosphoribosylamine--glycine ligase [Arsenicitalea aurantiaca]RUT31195.1 phosphoribosylamine--glycine ligase [Arsenicitalea aurantiaca]
MNILVIGSGGREHALCWALARSPRCDKLFVAPGNGGTVELAETAPVDPADHDAVTAFCRENAIDLVVIGPELPLVNGLSDDLRAAGILVFGPSRAAAQLEGSKAFTKALCDEMNIPTAAYARFDSEGPALDYVRSQGAPIVVKADGLAAGKGVTVAETLEAAEAAIRECFSGAFGAAGAEVVIEECLVGEEVSLFAVADGKNFVILESAQDHKRAFDGDTGPNTGGMGAYSPAPAMTPQMLEMARSQIIAPTIAGMAAHGTPFSGVLFAGLMITDQGPRLIEFNTRFGDPECQVLLLRLQSDLLDILEASARGELGTVTPRWRPDTALTVVMAAEGYPGSYEKGTEIRGLDGNDEPDCIVFHAGTKRDGDRVFANGGRVLNVTALGSSVAAAQARAYRRIETIDWPEGFCRRDIGWRALAREKA